MTRLWNDIDPWTYQNPDSEGQQFLVHDKKKVNMAAVSAHEILTYPEQR